MSQNATILAHLKRHKPITALEAIHEYGVLRLAARIGDLKDMGIKIRTDIIEQRGKRFARYRLAA